jgi:hypothetical protein
MSTELYKLYLDNLLASMKEQQAGLNLGNVVLTAPTCADDVLLMASNEVHMQELLDEVAAYASEQRYSLNPNKTTLTYFGQKPSGKLYLGNDLIEETTSFCHLGIERSSLGNTELVNDRITLAQRTVYAMIPAGMYGLDGLSPVTMRKLITAYVIPRMLHGLEAIILTKTETERLERGYRNILRNLLSLRKNVATAAIYLMFGMLPIKAELDLRILTLYGIVTRQQENTVIKDLARRQLANQASPSTSWFRYVADVAKEYGLHSMIHSALEIHFSKAEWKRTVNKSIQDTWFFRLQYEATQRSTLKFLDISMLNPGEAHPLWPHTAHSFGVQAASYRAKMIAGTYLLCSDPVEDLPHFITKCTALEDVREPIMLNNLYPLAKQLNLDVPDDSKNKCRFILNGGLVRSPKCLSTKMKTKRVSDGDRLARTRESELFIKLQSVCSTLCYKLHQRRAHLLARSQKL